MAEKKSSREKREKAGYKKFLSGVTAATEELKKYNHRQKKNYGKNN